jgi:predicted MFS family arabinose efflux permease
MKLGDRWSIALFGGMAIPYGVGNALVFTIIPFRLRKLGFTIEQIGTISTVLSIPTFCQFLYSFCVDYWITKRSWMIILSIFAGLCFASLELFSDLSVSHISLYIAIILLGQIFSNMIMNCVGGMIAGTLAGKARSQAATWKTAGYLLGNAIGVSVALELTQLCSSRLTAAILLTLGLIPGSCALVLPTSVSPTSDNSQPLFEEIGLFFRDKNFWYTLLLCLSPCCAAGAMNLFSALAIDFKANQHDVVLTNGMFGSLATVIGSALGGVVCSRYNHRKSYIMCSLSLAAIAILMTILPFNRYNYILGILSYSFIVGISLTVFAVLVLDLIGQTDSGASAKYSFFFSCANFPYAYVGYLDSRSHQRFGVGAVLLTDAALNLLGIFMLLLMARATGALARSASAGEQTLAR